MNEHATFRTMVRNDLKVVAEIEAESFTRLDPDFEVMTIHPDAWKEDVIEKVAFEEKRTQARVVEEGDGNVVAYYIYEVEEEAYLIRRLLVHPQYRRANFGRTILWFLYRLMCRSKSRKTLVGFVSERDVKTCQWMAHMGFGSKVIRHGWDDETDAVEFKFTMMGHDESEIHERCEEKEC